MTPDVPTSRRCTIPWRSGAPLVAIRKPAPARCPTTVGPDQPGRGVDGDADRLVDHHDRVVVVDDPDALDDLGHDRERVAQRRDDDVEHRAGVHPVALADDGAVDAARGPRPISSAARVRDSPNIRAMAASTRSPASPSGTSTTRWSAGMVTSPPGSPGVRCRLLGVRRSRPMPATVEADPAERLHHDQRGRDVDADVGDVEDRPVRQLGGSRRRGPGRGRAPGTPGR